MFSIITEFTVSPEHRDDFEKNFTASMEHTLPGVPGLQRSQLLRPTGGAGYLAVLEFDDEKAYATYASSASFHAAHGTPRKTFADDRKVSTYQAVIQLTD